MKSYNGHINNVPREEDIACAYGLAQYQVTAYEKDGDAYLLLNTRTNLGFDPLTSEQEKLRESLLEKIVQFEKLAKESESVFVPS